MADESQEAEETFEIVQNKKVFKDDYGKDIVDPDEINDWENQYDKIKGKVHKKKDTSKHEVTQAMTATNGSSNDRDGEP